MKIKEALKLLNKDIEVMIVAVDKNDDTKRFICADHCAGYLINNISNKSILEQNVFENIERGQDVLISYLY